MATKKRKVATAIAASVAAAALVLGGTFAWSSISQRALNESVVDINPGARLHDDFNGRNKDVYVENFGDDSTGVPIYARVRLDEYMEIGQDAGINKGDTNRVVTVLDKDDTDTLVPDINDVDTWQTYIPGATSVEHLFANNQTVYTEYWDWTMGNADTEEIYYMPTFNKNKDSLAADVNGTYEGNNPSDIVHYDDYVVYGPSKVATKTDTEVTDADSNNDEEDDGVQSADVALGYSTTDLSQPIDNYNVYLEENVEHTAEQISSGAEVISMATFFAAEADGGKGGVPGPYWVYDTDGWAYWAQPIQPGETTGLLLNSINMSKVPDDNWYYGINVVGQFATDADVETAFDNPTDDAADLIYAVSHGREIWALVTTADSGTSHSLSILGSYQPFTVGETYKGGEIVYAESDIDLKGYHWFGQSLWTPYSEDYGDTITSASVDNKVAPVSTGAWFSNLPNVTEVTGLTNIDFSNVTSMDGMFHGANLLSIDVSGWDVRNVWDFHGVFAANPNLETIEGLDTWQTDSATRFRSLFYKCPSLKNIGDLSGWDASKVTDISHLFYEDSSLETLTGTGIDQWDTGKAIEMENMFVGCTNLQSVDLSNWDTKNAEWMDGMFINCEKLTSVGDLSKWETGKVRGMTSMFNGCTALTEIKGLDQWDTSRVANMYYMFYDCVNLKSLDLAEWDVSNVTNMGFMFALPDAGDMTTLHQLESVGDLSKWDTGKVTDMTGMFDGCSKLKTLGDISNWDVSKAQVARMFRRCTALESLNLSNWNPKAATDFFDMFAHCHNITSVGDLSGWDVSNAESLRAMFYDCRKLTSVGNISSWNTSNVVYMDSTFYNCASFSSVLDLSGWNVDKVTAYNAFIDGVPAGTITPPVWKS